MFLFSINISYLNGHCFLQWVSFDRMLRFLNKTPFFMWHRDLAILLCSLSSAWIEQDELEATTRSRCLPQSSQAALSLKSLEQTLPRWSRQAIDGIRGGVVKIEQTHGPQPQPGLKWAVLKNLTSMCVVTTSSAIRQDNSGIEGCEKNEMICINNMNFFRIWSLLSLCMGVLPGLRLWPWMMELCGVCCHHPSLYGDLCQ